MGPRVLEEQDTLPGHEPTSVSQAAKKKKWTFPFSCGSNATVLT